MDKFLISISFSDVRRSIHLGIFISRNNSVMLHSHSMPTTQLMIIINDIYISPVKTITTTTYVINEISSDHIVICCK